MIGSSYVNGGTGPIVVIINKFNEASDIKISQLSRIYKGQMETWDDGQRVVAIDYPFGSQIKNDFYKIVLGEEPTKKFFKPGSPVPFKPMLAQSNQSAARFVASIPNAITYVYSSEVTDSVKVLKIDGQSPQDPNYPLR